MARAVAAALAVVAVALLAWVGADERARLLLAGRGEDWIEGRIDAGRPVRMPGRGEEVVAGRLAISVVSTDYVDGRRRTRRRELFLWSGLAKYAFVDADDGTRLVLGHARIEAIEAPEIEDALRIETDPPEDRFAERIIVSYGDLRVTDDSVRVEGPTLEKRAIRPGDEVTLHDPGRRGRVTIFRGRRLEALARICGARLVAAAALLLAAALALLAGRRRAGPAVIPPVSG